MTTSSIELTHAPAAGHAHHGGSKSKATFARHFVEMMVSMGVGMGIGGALGVSGVTDTPIKALLWFLVMAVPMVGWMRIRGMSWRQAAEMSLGMAIPTTAALVLFSVGIVSAKAVNGIEHMSMIPGTLAVMLYRRTEYGL